MKQSTFPLLIISPGYPVASYPYGQPLHGRTVWHISTVARKSCAPGALFPSLPVAAWTVTRYDDAPRKFHVRRESDSATTSDHFTAPSFRKAIARINEMAK